MRYGFSNRTWLYYLTSQQGNNWYQLRFEKASSYITLCLETDLLGDWTIVICSGRRFSKNGQKRLIAFTSYDAAYEQLGYFIQNHLQQRYKLCSFATNHLLLISLIAHAGNYQHGNDDQLNRSPALKHAYRKTTDPTRPKRNKSIKKVIQADERFQQLSLF
ncbi:Uncharacterised protein [Legionella beliardensis]|uniref:WGR domain-containing protein n=1 Tax=Legionella beliardensis TaxID=91822 RepID=A0A378I3E6_9GAMM|nr:hypothetical protein [Legionella beliardensis]STX29245.1 Uncharacterised protein [Legionella beliardensis]